MTPGFQDCKYGLEKSWEGAWKPQEEAAGGSGMGKAHCGWGAGHETEEIFHKYSSDWIQWISKRKTEETSRKCSDLGIWTTVHFNKMPQINKLT